MARPKQSVAPRVAAKPAHAAPDRRPGEIRIVGGAWKRSKIAVPDAPGLRPTPDRVRETLFNWLGQDLTGWRCADVFAGSGALGFECASRGAASVWLAEPSATLLAGLEAVKQRLGAENVALRRGDGIGWLKREAPGALDLVLLDPPFESELYAPALAAAAPVVGPQGYVYLEAARAWTDAELADLGLALHRTGKAGAVHFHLLKKAAAA